MELIRFVKCLQHAVTMVIAMNIIINCGDYIIMYNVHYNYFQYEVII